MDTVQFDEPKRAQAIALLEDLPWGDVEQEIYCLEVTLALALEATGAAIELWEQEGFHRFRDEFALSAEEVASLDDEWRLAYIHDCSTRLPALMASSLALFPDALQRVLSRLRSHGARMGPSHASCAG